MAATPALQLEGQILSLWRRDSERNSDHKQASELSYGVFHRERQASVRLDRDGIVDSHEYHRTEGNLKEIRQSGGTPAANVGERAFCVQSLPQIDQLCRDFPEFSESMTVPCAWGENATISGPLDCTTVCIGDVFHVFGPGGVKRSLELEVASPRRPCSNVDKRHGKRYNQRGVRAHTARTGLAGWFYRVLEEGEIAEGDTLRCAHARTSTSFCLLCWPIVASSASFSAYQGPRAYTERTADVCSPQAGGTPQSGVVALSRGSPCVQ
jgi:MOSC domain-containing protein YiiM